MADPQSSKPWHERLDDSAAKIYSGGYPGTAYTEALGAGAKILGSAANSAVNGAYSVFPDTLNYPYAILRGSGVLGKDEAHRFDQEMAVMGEGAKQTARHPRLAAETLGRAMSDRFDPLIFPYLAGR